MSEFIVEIVLLVFVIVVRFFWKSNFLRFLFSLIQTDLVEPDMPVSGKLLTTHTHIDGFLGRGILENKWSYLSVRVFN